MSANPQKTDRFTQCGNCNTVPQSPLESLRLCACTEESHSPEKDVYPALCIDRCYDCNEDGVPDGNFPYPCGKPGHRSCWATYVPPKPRKATPGQDARTHEPRDISISQRIARILQSGSTEESHRDLHRQDMKCRWFKAARRDSGNVLLDVTDRYYVLTDEGRQQLDATDDRFPCLVSFVGETQVGKSTLIKALIELSKADSSAGLSLDSETDSPVPARSASLDPTSSGVNLYSDPATICSDRPTFFVDVEGFGASTARASAEQAETDLRDQNPDDKRYNERLLARIILDKSRGQSEIVGDLYPRFVYVFSDVLCFVISEPATLGGRLKQLLEWCVSGLEASINERLDKTLILIVNKPREYNSDYVEDPQSFEEQILGQDVRRVWEDSKKLKRVYEKMKTGEIKTQHEILTTLDFVRIYFKRVKVCYIPNKNHKSVRDVDLDKSYKYLRDLIKENRRERKNDGLRNYSLYNVGDFGRLCDLALSHFANSDLPFDFYEQSRRHSPNPQNMADHITKLLIQNDRYDGPDISRQLYKVVASCFVRDTIMGGAIVMHPDSIFLKTYKDICVSGIKQFYTEHAQCQFVYDGNRCICKYEDHGSHRFQGVRKAISGHFMPEHIETEVENIKAVISKDFKEIYRGLIHPLGRQGQASRQEIERMIFEQQRTILSTNLNNFWTVTKNYKSCFACLRSVPHQVFPCGHSLCDTCVTKFGRPSGAFNDAYDILDCVFCRRHFLHPQICKMKPVHAGVRILTLDGGGVRGVVELVVIRKLLSIINLNLPIHVYFDLIVGTSTGGLVTLGVAMANLKVDTMVDKFEEICKNTFRNTRATKPFHIFANNPLSKSLLLALGAWASIYDEQELSKSLKSLLSVNGDQPMSLFGSPIQTDRQPLVRIGLTAAKNMGKTYTIMANYNRPVRKDQHDFERGESEYDDLKAYEAGLASAAAPIYFTPFVKAETSTAYVDGGLESNNPFRRAIKEYRQIWPGARLDSLISIGTGVFDTYAQEFPWLLDITEARAHLRSLFNTFQKHTCGEEAWNTFKRDGGHDDSRVYRRLNPHLGNESCRLNEYSKIPSLKEKVERYYDPHQSSRGKERYNELESVALSMMANLFYFEPEPAGYTEHEKGGLRYCMVEGRVLCRLAKGDPALIELIKRIDHFGVLVAPPGKPIQSVEKIVIDRNQREDMERGTVFQTKNFSLSSYSKDDWVCITVKFKPLPAQGQANNPSVAISGFGCKMKDLYNSINRKSAYPYAPGTNHTYSLARAQTSPHTPQQHEVAPAVARASTLDIQTSHSNERQSTSEEDAPFEPRHAVAAARPYSVATQADLPSSLSIPRSASPVSALTSTRSNRNPFSASVLSVVSNASTNYETMALGVDVNDRLSLRSFDRESHYELDNRGEPMPSLTELE